MEFLADKMKRSFFLAAVMSILLTKRMEKKLDGNYTRILRAILNKSWSSCCTATYLPSRKLSNLDETDMQDTAGDVGTSSYGTPHMAEQKQGDQLEPTYSSSVSILVQFASRLFSLYVLVASMWCVHIPIIRLHIYPSLSTSTVTMELHP